MARSRAKSGGVLEEIDRWQRLGVATLPGPRGRKGPRLEGWPRTPHEDCWRLSRDVAHSGPTNLVIRTGPSADGSRTLGAIDLDGKCPCGHDRDEHADGIEHCVHRSTRSDVACTCEHYTGVAPETVLARLRGVLPPTVAISRTARGFHLVFWVVRPLEDGPLPEFSADLFGGLTPHAVQVPPSRQSTGTARCAGH